MAKTSTTFQKGAGGRKPGAKNKETIAKELLRSSLWDKVAGKMTEEGIEKCWTELMTLEGKDFVYAFNTLLEYFKPKLTRTTLEGGDKPIQIVEAETIQNIASKINAASSG